MSETHPLKLRDRDILRIEKDFDGNRGRTFEWGCSGKLASPHLTETSLRSVGLKRFRKRYSFRIEGVLGKVINDSLSYMPKLSQLGAGEEKRLRTMTSAFCFSSASWGPLFSRFVGGCK